jgi:predicted dehydrogenase
MALNVAECDRMIEAAQGGNVKLGIAYYRHFYPVVDRAREIIASGEIGKPIMAQINAFEWFDPDPANPRRWLIEKAKSGGGPMFDFGCHRIEVLLNILGPISHTKAFLKTVLFDRLVEDTGVAVFEFERGACGTLSVTHAAREAQDTLHIFGSEGSLHVASLNEGKMVINTGAVERVELLPPAPNFHLPLIADFAQAVQDQREPKVDGHAGRAVAMIEAEICGA